MKPIFGFDYSRTEGFRNMLSELPIKLEHILLDEVRDKMITPLVYNVGLQIYSINRNLS